jgi:hypothetical protein
VNTRRRSEPTGNPARGAALIVVAIVVGLVLLRNGIDTGEVVASNGGTSKTTTTTVKGGGTTTTTVALKPPAEVKVLVANGSTVNGAAKRVADALKAKGYTTLPPASVPKGKEVATTTVYFQPGFQREAAAVAAALGAPPLPAVAPMPATPPVAPSTCNVLVILGPDKAPKA